MAGSLINKDSVHFIGQASAFTLGAEFITDGDFPDFDNWTQGTWTIAGNKASENNAGSNSDLTQALTGLTDGQVYRITFEVTDYTDGNVTAVFDGVEIEDKSAVGTFTGYAVAVGTTADLDIRADATFTGSISNVSVVAWVGDPDAGGGCTIESFTGTLLDYMTATGGVIHEEATLDFDDNGSGKVQITAGSTWDQTPIVGTLVNVVFSAPLDSTEDSGIYEIIAATTTTIDIDADYAGADAALKADVWIGGAFPDIATAIGDSTLSQDPDDKYRKRYICVNVPMLVDAATIFVAETSETAHREDDGSRKIIGFYDSISVVSLKAGTYNVVSDMDKGQPYYAGARKAFNQDESFSVINPDGKWIEWDAQGNDFGATGVIVMNTSNLEFRNLKIHNTIADAGTEGLIHTDTANFNVTFTNCWFDTASRWQVSDLTTTGGSITDCFFGDGLAVVPFGNWHYAVFLKCIFSGDSRDAAAAAIVNSSFNSCLFYKGTKGATSSMSSFFFNCIFIDQTSACVFQGSIANTTGAYYNNIFSPLAANDIAIKVTKGSISPAGFNNIMYSVTAGAVLTNPIDHAQITPNPPLPVGTLQVDPQFVNPADGDFRRRVFNDGIGDIFSGRSTIGVWGPGALPRRGRRSRYR